MTRKDMAECKTNLDKMMTMMEQSTKDHAAVATQKHSTRSPIISLDVINIDQPVEPNWYRLAASSLRAGNFR